MKKTLLLISLLFLLFSCAFHSGNMTGSTAVTDGNFQIIEFVSGSAKTTHILGIGGLNTATLVRDAKKNMYLRYPLGKGQAYANITVDFKRSFFLFVGTTIATVSADLIVFDSSTEESDVFSKLESQEKSEYQNSNYVQNYLDTNDSLGVFTYGTLENMKFIERKGKNRYELISRNSVTYILQEKNLYQTKKGANEFEHKLDIGDKVEWQERGETLKGSIVGINPYTAVVSQGNILIEKQIDQITLSNP